MTKQQSSPQDREELKEEFKAHFEGFDYNNMIIHDGDTVYLP